MAGKLGGRDFDLQILKAGGTYVANVLDSPAGEADNTFNLPLDGVALDALFRGLGHARKATRGANAPEVRAARDFGGRLLDTVFAGRVRDVFQRSLGIVHYADRDLRIRLRLTNVPELLDLPWELLFDQGPGRFLALESFITLVRHLPVGEPVTPMQVERPLRVLVASANPKDPKYRTLDAAQELANLERALGPLQEAGQVVVERYEGVDQRLLLQALRRGPWHVFHFIGHGEFDAGEQLGYLILEDGKGGARRISADRLAQMLRGCPSLRLAVLNACEGGRTSRTDPFAGLAQSLVRGAMPAVVAMQFPVTDEAAIEFAASFYRGLAGARPVDLALADARRDVGLAGEDGEIEWATPVLYMRGDGQLFAFEAGGQCPDAGRGAQATEAEVQQVELPPVEAASVEPRIWLEGEVFRDAPHGPEMVVIPIRGFTMGSPADEEGRFDDEGPQREVRIGKGFALGKYAVTVGDFRRFVENSGYRTEAECNPDKGIWTWNAKENRWAEIKGKSWRDPGFGQDEHHPAVGVTWNDAQEYLNWLSGVTGKNYRLPSEAEWEYACRGVTPHSRFWGDDPKDAFRYANVADQSLKRKYPRWPWTIHDCDDGFAETAPVGNYAPNPFGLHDMLGNVWEWCEDWWNDNYEGAPENGSAWLSGDGDRRVVRGGAWSYDSRSVRAASRNWFDITIRIANVGFRPARTLD
jgi:formylglycine-generating enzyme required for sulfatase activity